MPHCVIEYSATLRGRVDWQDVFRALQDAIAATGQFNAADVKHRAIAYDDFAFGDGSEAAAFVALAIRILDGRSDEIKATLAEAAHEALTAALAGVREPRPINVTVQIEDLHRASYRRSTA